MVWNRYRNFLLSLRDVYSCCKFSYRWRHLYVALSNLSSFCSGKRIDVTITQEVSSIWISLFIYVHCWGKYCAAVSEKPEQKLLLINLGLYTAEDSACSQLAFHSLYGGCCCYTSCIRRKVRRRFDIPVSLLKNLEKLIGSMYVWMSTNLNWIRESATGNAFMKLYTRVWLCKSLLLNSYRTNTYEVNLCRVIVLAIIGRMSAAAVVLFYKSSMSFVSGRSKVSIPPSSSCTLLAECKMYSCRLNFHSMICETEIKCVEIIESFWGNSWRHYFVCIFSAERTMKEPPSEQEMEGYR